MALGTAAATAPPPPKPTPTAERIELNHRYAAANRRLAGNPSDVAALIERGKVRLQLEDLTGAVEDLNKAVSLEPANVDGLVARGTALIQDGRLLAAMTDLKKAIELDSRNAEAHKQLGTVEAQRSQPARAIEEYSRAFELDPSMTSALFNRAVVRRQTGDLAGALADADRLVTLEPKQPDSFVLRAGIRLQMKESAKAIADYDRAIALDPNDARAYGGRSAARSAAGDTAGSAEDAARAQRVVPAAPAVPRRPTPPPGETRVLNPGTGDRRLLQLVLKSGSRYRFQTDQQPVSAEGPVPSAAKTSSSRMLFTVGAVAAGRAEVGSVLEDVQLSGNAEAETFMSKFRPIILGLKTTATYDRLGRRTGWNVVTPLKGELANIVPLIARSQGERDLGFLGVQYPATEVGVGARWQVVLDMQRTLADAEPAGTEIRGGLIYLTYELLAFGKRSGKDAAQLRVTTAGQWMLIPKGIDPAQGDKFRLTSSGSMWIELANGVPLESESETKYEADRREVAYRTVTRNMLARVESADTTVPVPKKRAPSPKNAD